MKDTLHAAIKEVLIALGAPDASFTVERPGDMDHGDYATNAALMAGKALNRSPRDVAERIAKRLWPPAIEGVGRVEVANAGFVNVFLSRPALATIVYAAAGTPPQAIGVYAGKTVMVEYTQPNPFKPFHIGHLMSNALGESIARILERTGAAVIRANYQGDVGPHVAKALYVLLREGKPEPSIEEIGAAYQRGNALYEEDPEDKAAIDVLNHTIYARTDKRVNRLYAWGLEVSLGHFEELYRMLGTKFDLYFFESESGPKGLELVRTHPELFEKSDGATVFRGERFGLHTRVFVTSQGLPTYEAKDLGLVELKRERAEFDLSLVITAVEQDEYFKVVRKAAELVFGDTAGTFLHRSHGLMRFAAGKMSSRRGNVITGESLLEDLKKEASVKMRERAIADRELIARQVAVGAVKYAILKQGSGRDIIFDPEKSLSLEGDSGPYLQYAHTRARSLVAAAAKAGINPDSTDAPERPTALERLLIHYPEVLMRGARELEPHYLTAYLTELAAAFNRWYGATRVIGGPYPSFGLLLTQAFAQTMRSGLETLGIPVPEEM